MRIWRCVICVVDDVLKFGKSGCGRDGRIVLSEIHNVGLRIEGAGRINFDSIPPQQRVGSVCDGGLYIRISKSHLVMTAGQKIEVNVDDGNGDLACKLSAEKMGAPGVSALKRHRADPEVIAGNGGKSSGACYSIGNIEAAEVHAGTGFRCG